MSLLVAVGLLLAPPSTAAVRWEAPSSCPDAFAVQQRLEQRLGREVDGEVSIEGTITGSAAAGYTLTLHTQVGDSRDARTLDADDCNTLTDAAVLVAAAAVDPIALAIHVRVVPPALPASPGVARPTPPPAVDQPPPPPPPPPERPGVQWRLGVAGGLDVASLPGPSATVDGGLIVGWRNVDLGVGGAYVSPRTARTADGAVTVQLGVVSLRAAARIWARPDVFELPLGVGLEAGAMRGEGRGVAGARAVSKPWVAGLAHAGLRVWLIGELALRLRGELVVPLQRPSFELADPGPALALFTPPVATGRVLVGIEGVVRDGNRRRRRRVRR